MLSQPTRATLATLTLLSVIACSRPPRLAADLVITRANVWTGNSAQPTAMAVAIVGDRIVEVGGADEIEHWRGANTTVLNAEGRRLVPGFNDAHVHFVDGGTQLDNVDLRDADTQAEFARRINERAKAKPGEWILGGDWDDERWTPAALPTRHLVDDVTNSTPVFVVRGGGHMALANSAALGRAGITERTQDPPGGVIVRGADGFPTGVLKDAAMDFVTRVIPKMTPEQRLHAVKRALELAASLGVTSVQDMNPAYQDIAAYADLANRGELTARVYAAPAESGWYDQAKLGIHRAFGSTSLRLGAVSGFGDQMQDVNLMRTRLMAADYAGLQLCIGANGDAGLARTLELFADVVRANGGRDRRFRIEQANHLGPADVDRFASSDVIASVQPARVMTTGAFRTLLDKGVRTSLGTNWPLAPLNPMLTLSAATAQKVTAAEALTAYTSGSAFAEFQETEKGTIARGKLADLVILSDDVLSIPPAQVKDVKILATIVGGKIVHQRKP
jgi:predicted amidohydrolase YtcJ